MFKQNFKINVGLSEENLRIIGFYRRLSVAIGMHIVHLMIRRRAADASAIMDSKEMGLQIVHLHQVIKYCR